MPKYKLKRRFYDGERLHEIDAIMDFSEGKQPSTAVRVTEKMKAPEPQYEEVSEDGDDLFPDVQPGDTLSSLSKKGK